MPTIVSFGLENVIIQIDGTILLSKNAKDYGSYDYHDAFFVHKRAKNLTHTGDGEIDGQGWMWWFRFTFNKDPVSRPRLV